MKLVGMILKGIFGSLILTCILGSSVGYADPITVSFDTSSLAGGTYSLVFDLFDGDAISNNTVTLGSFQFGNGQLLGSPFLAGGASGSLSGTAMLNDASFFNEFFQDFSAGSLLSFVLDFTNSFAGGTPDSFTFSIIDSLTGFSIPTLDPLGTDVFLAVYLDSSLGAVVQGFGSDSSRTNLQVGPPAITAAPVPEPGSLLLLSTGLIGFALFGLRRRKTGRAR